MIPRDPFSRIEYHLPPSEGQKNLGAEMMQRILDAQTDDPLERVALDVFAVEPLPPDDPLWDCPRLLITPHVAGNMTLGYTVDRIVALFLEDFANYCAGRPLKRRVDREKGY